MSDSLPKTQNYPVLPLRDIVVFPGMIVPLFVGREKSVKAIEESQREGKYIMLAAQRDARTSNPGQKDIYTIGTLGEVVQLIRLSDGPIKVLVEGMSVSSRSKEIITC